LTRSVIEFSRVEKLYSTRIELSRVDSGWVGSSVVELVSKSDLFIKSSLLDISELRNYFAKIKLITSCSKWTGP